jgi:glutamyl-tRNA reductase
MHIRAEGKINEFWIVGINYKKTDASIRGQFAINIEQYANILTLATGSGINELFILSTCNRTEIYGFAQCPELLMNLICSESAGDLATFSKLAYIKHGTEAIEHLFNVSAGLDSQILGDFEILGQIKTAVKFAKEKGFVGSCMERMINSVLQSSKAIKTKTNLSGGTVSVAFAAVQYIKERFEVPANKKILLVGTGKMGRNTCKNMVDYLGTNNITLINRTEEKAAELAKELKLKFAPVEQLSAEINSSDIIVIATNAPVPTMLRSHIGNHSNKLIIDMSVPCNVEEEVKKLAGVTFIGVDELSRIKDDTLQMRQAEVPKALDIIKEHIGDFMDWYAMRKNVPILKEAKNKLQQLSTNPFPGCNAGHATVYGADPDERIQKVINTLAIKMRNEATVGCYFIEAINEFIA